MWSLDWPGDRSSLRLKRKSLGLQMASLKMSTFCLNKSGSGYCPVTFPLHRGNCLCSRVLPCILAQSSDLRKLLCAQCPVCKLGIAALSDPKGSYKGNHLVAGTRAKQLLCFLFPLTSAPWLLLHLPISPFHSTLLHPVYHPTPRLFGLIHFSASF